MGRGRNGNAAGSNRPANASGNGAATQRARASVEAIIKNNGLTTADFTEKEINELVETGKQIQKAGEADGLTLMGINQMMDNRKEAKPTATMYMTRAEEGAVSSWKNMTKGELNEISSNLKDTEAKTRARLESNNMLLANAARSELATIQKQKEYLRALYKYRDRFNLK